MRVAVTGANGFLGREVVAALAAGGHDVRALVRPSSVLEGWEPGERVEVRRVDPRRTDELAKQLEGIEAVIHLAAAMSGSDFGRFQETIAATEGLLCAMERAGTDRLVLCSSFSVYDWLRAPEVIDEETPLLEGADVYARGGYACAKLWQERIARRSAAEHGWCLTIIRPGFVWGPGNEVPSGSIGPAFGRLQLVIAPGRELPLTHVANTADFFRACLEGEATCGETLNLVDGHGLTAWRFATEAAGRSGRRSLRLPIPHWIAWPTIRGIFSIARLVLGPRVKLPYDFMPHGYAQGYRPHRYRTDRARRILHWEPRLTARAALDATWPRGG